MNGCDDCFMTQVIDRSTFGAKRMGENVLDLILTSYSERVLEIEYCPRLESVRIGHAVISLPFGIYLKDKNEAK